MDGVLETKVFEKRRLICRKMAPIASARDQDRVSVLKVGVGNDVKRSGSGVPTSLSPSLCSSSSLTMRPLILRPG